MASSLVLYGSSVADTTLTTACDMASASGGSETSKSTTYTGASAWGEITSQGLTVATVASVPATPTGSGWVFKPGAGTFAPGNWSAIFNYHNTVGANSGVSFTLTIDRYSGGSYTNVGSITLSGQATSATKSQYAFAVTSMPTFTTAENDLVHIGLWTTEAASFGPSVIYESTSSTSGVALDMQVTTSVFTPVENPNNTIATDTFARANQSGWGTASDGETWTTTQGGGATFAIAGNTGTITNIASDVHQKLGTLSANNVSAVVRVSVTAAGDYAGIALRYSDDNNWVRFIMNTTTAQIKTNKTGVGLGTPATASVSHSINTSYWMRFAVVGNAILARTWADGTSEPGTWLITSFDSSFTGGGFGLMAIPASTSDAVSFDSFLVTYAPQPNLAPTATTYTPRALSSTLVSTGARYAIPRAFGGTLVPAFIPRAFGAPLVIPGIVSNAMTYATYYIPRAIESTLVLTTNDNILQAIDASSFQVLASATDALTASDSATSYGDNALPVDALSVADTPSYADGATIIDALSVSDSIANQDGANLSELNTASDIGNSQQWNVDALTASDVGGMQQWNIDALTASDSPSYGDTTIPLDSIPAGDSLQGLDGYGATDALSANDSASSMVSASGGNNAMSFEDDLVVSDRANYADGPLYTDISAISDAFVRTDTYQPTEGQSVLDSLSIGEASSWVDMIPIGDTLVGTDAYSTLDALTSGDIGNLQLWMLDALSALDLAFVTSSPLTPVWVMRDGRVTWKTRDDLVVWVTRDDKAQWASRDDKATWDTRDDTATWKARQ